ncbi:MAG: hypothetical protein HPY53_13665 [Brevinematales bacterium]|nr:hypothetical protein [Brevinematales bacterium]
MEFPTKKEFEEGIKKYEENEPREGMYKVATFYIEQFWDKPAEMADGLGALLLTWNQAFYRYGFFNFNDLEDYIKKNFKMLEGYRNRKIDSFDIDQEKDEIKIIFNDLREVLKITVKEKGKDKVKRSPVAVAKALHLLAPHFFPIWDQEIAKGYECNYQNNPAERQAEKYIEFCKISKDMYEGLKKYCSSHPNKTVLKLIDEYNYSKYTLTAIIAPVESEHFLS